MDPIVGLGHCKRQAPFAGAEALEALRAEVVEKKKEEASAEEITEWMDLPPQHKDWLAGYASMYAQAFVCAMLAGAPAGPLRRSSSGERPAFDGKAPEEQWQALLDMSSYNLCEGCHVALPAEEQRPFEALNDGEPTPMPQVECPPYHLKAWEAGGRKTFDFMVDDVFPADATTIKMPKRDHRAAGLASHSASLQTLDLSCCSALTSLPAELANLTSLRTLKLDGEHCEALTGMPNLSRPFWRRKLQVEGLPDHLEAWEQGGRKSGTFEKETLICRTVAAAETLQL